MKQAVSFFQDDGYRIAADLYGAADEASGMVIFCHGWAGTKNVTVPALANEVVTRTPFAALVFDYSGWGESEGARGRIDPHHQSLDVRAAVSYVARRHPRLGSRIVLFGFSFGGAVATYAAATDSRVAGVVSIAAFAEGARWLADMRSLHERAEFRRLLDRDRGERVLTGHSARVAPDVITPRDPVALAFSQELLRAFPERAFTLDLATADRIMDFAPIAVAPRLAGRPALFIHCERDVRSDPASAFELAAASDGQVRIIPGLGHYDIYAGRGLDAVSSAAAAFLNHLLVAVDPTGLLQGASA